MSFAAFGPISFAVIASPTKQEIEKKYHFQALKVIGAPPILQWINDDLRIIQLSISFHQLWCNPQKCIDAIKHGSGLPPTADVRLRKQSEPWPVRHLERTHAVQVAGGQRQPDICGDGYRAYGVDLVSASRRRSGSNVHRQPADWRTRQSSGPHDVAGTGPRVYAGGSRLLPPPRPASRSPTTTTTCR